MDKVQEELQSELDTISIITNALALLDPHENEHVRKVVELMARDKVIRAVAYVYGEGDEGSVHWCKTNNEIFEDGYEPEFDTLIDEADSYSTADWAHAENDLAWAMGEYIFRCTSFDYNGDAEEGYIIIDLTRDPIGYFRLRHEVKEWEDGDSGDI
jgi:hypothetical protein